MKNGKFEVGDRVVGLKDNGYGFTNNEMSNGLVLKLDLEDDTMLIEIVDHKHSIHVGSKYWVKNDLTKFQLLREPTKVKNIKKKKHPKQTNNGLPFSINVSEEQGKTFIIIDKKHTICIEGNFGISSVNSDSTDVFNEEIGKALAVYRMSNKKGNK
jgi:hypothetical protein